MKNHLILCLAFVLGTAEAQIHLVPDHVRRAELAAEAHIERMVMVPMRDGVHLASRIYLPKNIDGPVPAHTRSGNRKSGGLALICA